MLGPQLFAATLQMPDKVKSLSPNDRFAIALYLPDEIIETELRVSPPEKKSIHTPVLFVLGESDYRTPQDSGGEQLFRALKFLKRPTAMVVFPRETHELSRSGDGRMVVKPYLGITSRLPVTRAQSTKASMTGSQQRYFCEDCQCDDWRDPSRLLAQANTR